MHHWPLQTNSQLKLLTRTLNFPPKSLSLIDFSTLFSLTFHSSIHSLDSWFHSRNTIYDRDSKKVFYARAQYKIMKGCVAQGIFLLMWTFGCLNSMDVAIRILVISVYSSSFGVSIEIWTLWSSSSDCSW